MPDCLTNANGLVYEIYQRCKHHGKFATIQMILCLLNKSLISYFS